MTNFRNEAVNVESLNLVSREYRLENIAGQLEEAQGGLVLDLQERVTVHYRLVPVQDDVADRDVMCSVGDCSSSASCLIEPASAKGEIVDFLCLEGAHSKFQSALRTFELEDAKAEDEESQPRHVSQIRRAKSAMSSVTDDSSPVTHPTSIGRLYPEATSKLLVDLICQWKPVGADRGQTHTLDLTVRSKETSRGCPVTITCRYPACVSHNFANGPAVRFSSIHGCRPLTFLTILFVCLFVSSQHVPFEVTARNRLVSAGVDFEFAVERPKTFEFMGADSFQWTFENGGDELTIPMHAVIPSGGVYNLQQIRVTVQKQDKKVPYLFPLQWLVTVKEE